MNIVTLYNSYNFGAFLQAYSLQNVLKKGEADVAFLYMGQNAEAYFWRNFRYIRRPKELLFQLHQRRKFIHAVRSHLKVEKFEANRVYENVIIGSDEMWNIQNGSFAHYMAYFGVGIKAQRLLSYAASGNKTPALAVLAYGPDINFSQFSKISVRDDATADMVYEITGMRPITVCDPTILYNEFEGLATPVKATDYILVYTYSSNLSEKEKEAVRENAHRRGKKLVSIGMYNAWCDENIAATPFEFLSYIKWADAVITSTFHGTVFSILFSKEFFVFANGNEKILDLLRKFGLSSRIADEDTDLTQMEEAIDYLDVAQQLKNVRQASMNWLHAALEVSK